MCLVDGKLYSLVNRDVKLIVCAVFVTSGVFSTPSLQLDNLLPEHCAPVSVAEGMIAGTVHYLKP